MTATRRLKVVPTEAAAVSSKCSLVVEAVLAGKVECRVQALTPLVGPGQGSIRVRLGRVVVVLEDREAYEVLRRAWHEVEAVVDQALPEQPLPAYRPRSSR